MYEYHVDIKQSTWLSWEDKLRSGWRYNPRFVYISEVKMFHTLSKVIFTFLKTYNKREPNFCQNYCLIYVRHRGSYLEHVLEMFCQSS